MTPREKAQVTTAVSKYYEHLKVRRNSGRDNAVRYSSGMATAAGSASVLAGWSATTLFRWEWGGSA